MQFLPNSEHCFVCGSANPLGLRVRFRWNGKCVWTEFTPDERRMGYKGIVHGGLLCALLDETMGWASAMVKGRFCMAVELQIRFVKRCPIDRKLIIEGWMTADRRHLWEAEGQIRDEEGTIYTKGKGKFVPLSVEETREVMNYLQFHSDTIPTDYFLFALE